MRLLPQFSSRTRDPETAERIAKDCLILPSSGVNLDEVARLADIGADGPPNRPLFAWAQFSKGLSDYRLGHFSGAVACAVLAVHGGLCRNVLVYRAMNGRSGRRMSRVERDNSGALQFTVPYGVAHAAASFGHHATAHMARFGTTTEDFGHVAVMQRKHALLNPKAVMRQPMTLEDHQNSRWIIYPYRLLDCCQRRGVVPGGRPDLLVEESHKAFERFECDVQAGSGKGLLQVGTGRFQEARHSVQVAAQVFGAEGVLYGESGGWRQLLRRAVRRPPVSGAASARR